MLLGPSLSTHLPLSCPVRVVSGTHLPQRCQGREVGHLHRKGGDSLYTHFSHTRHTCWRGGPVWSARLPASVKPTHSLECLRVVYFWSFISCIEKEMLVRTCHEVDALRLWPFGLRTGLPPFFLWGSVTWESQGSPVSIIPRVPLSGKQHREVSMTGLGSLDGERIYTHSNGISGPLIRQFCFYESIMVMTVLGKMWNCSHREPRIVSFKTGAT